MSMSNKEKEILEDMQTMFENNVADPDVVKEPEHYKNGMFEVIDEMLMVFGWEATVQFCKINAWKYRARAPFKGKMAEDMAKADRYLEYAREIEIRNNTDAVDLIKWGR